MVLIITIKLLLFSQIIDISDCNLVIITWLQFKYFLFLQLYDFLAIMHIAHYLCNYKFNLFFYHKDSISAITNCLCINQALSSLLVSSLHRFLNIILCFFILNFRHVSFLNTIFNPGNITIPMLGFFI